MIVLCNCVLQNVHISRKLTTNRNKSASGLHARVRVFKRHEQQLIDTHCSPYPDKGNVFVELIPLSISNEQNTVCSSDAPGAAMDFEGGRRLMTAQLPRLKDAWTEQDANGNCAGIKMKRRRRTTGEEGALDAGG